MSDLGSLLFYVISFIITTFLFRLHLKHDSKFFLVLSFLIPCLVGGLRFNVGTDYYIYSYISQESSSVDLCFNIINHIATSLGGGNWIFFIYNFLSLLFAYLGIKSIDKKYQSLSLISYLFLYYTLGFNIMRQMLSVSIFFYSIQFIKEKRIIRYYICALLALASHTSAIITLFVYPVLVTKSKLIKIFCATAIMGSSLVMDNIIVGISSISFLNHFSIYTSYSGTSFSNFSFFIELGLLMIILFNRNGLIKNNRFNNTLILIYIFGVILTFSGFLSPFIKRIALFFCFPSILLLGQLPYIQKEQRNKLLYYFGLIGFLIIRFTVSAYILKQSNLIPYNIIQL